jgi:hypothetical protein
MQHEPSGLLGHADGLGDLDAGDSFLQAVKDEDAEEPLVKRETAFFENRAVADGERLAGLAALVNAGSLCTYAGSSTITKGGFDLGIGEAGFLQKVDAGKLIRELLDELKQIGFALHARNLASFSVRVKYISALKIEQVVDHLSSEFRRALSEAIRQEIPDANFDEHAMFRAFKRKVSSKCSTWENVPDQYVEK